MVSFLSVSTFSVSSLGRYANPLDASASPSGEVPVEKARNISPEKFRPAAWPVTYTESGNEYWGVTLWACEYYLGNAHSSMLCDSPQLMRQQRGIRPMHE